MVEGTRLRLGNLSNLWTNHQEVIHQPLPWPWKVGAVQIPVYNRSDPALWFIMCESTFKLAVPKPITESVTKFNYVVSHLPPEVASLVRDILMNPDATDPYTHLKTELINRSGESSHQEIRQFLSGEELAVTDVTLDKAAEISDRILEVTSVPMEIHAVNKNNSNSMEEKLLCEIEKLNARIDKLEFSRSRSPFRRNRSNQRSKGNSQNRNSSVCWYHRCFGKNYKPEKCISPCNFQGNGNGEE
ncbi:hypothetical protein AVEN_219145-1 [Araneus ventricosus]|uniref:DUF7041 domain-containing protein n=1 Tax=Araneus ventricosus TaxID=182803 RepID=A0A4Y2FST6_ARAVE|nr:hypothetical protein AVEN_219145-1 [Araneus ventricosus]